MNDEDRISDLHELMDNMFMNRDIEQLSAVMLELAISYEEEMPNWSEGFFLDSLKWAISTGQLEIVNLGYKELGDFYFMLKEYELSYIAYKRASILSDILKENSIKKYVERKLGTFKNKLKKNQKDIVDMESESNKNVWIDLNYFKKNKKYEKGYVETMKEVMDVIEKAGGIKTTITDSNGKERTL